MSTDRYYSLYIREGVIVQAPDYSSARSAHREFNRHVIKSEKAQVKGRLSRISRSKMAHAISNLHLAAKVKRSWNDKFKSWYNWKLNFITLTLPGVQSFTDEYFRRHLLNHFLTVISRQYHPSGYVWKLESQANGNIHAHIIFDVYIPYNDLRTIWNRILSKTNIIDEYAQAHLSRNPNSTDVHSLIGVKDVIQYLMKYMDKHDDSRRLIKGKLWGCSDNLKDKIKVSLHADDWTLTESVAKNEIEEVLVPELNDKDIRIYRFKIPTAVWLSQYFKEYFHNYIQIIYENRPNPPPYEE